MRYNVATASFTYEYFIANQQGNVRVSFEDNGGAPLIRQENSYYPYGMAMQGNYLPADPNKKLYNARSDWQDELGGLADYYSTFFREYNLMPAGFNSMDMRVEGHQIIIQRLL